MYRGHPLAGLWAPNYSSIIGKNQRQMKEEELGLSEMPGAGYKEKMGEKLYPAFERLG